MDSTLHELSFQSAPLWLQMHGLPLGQMNRASALEYGVLAGRVLDVDFDNKKQVWGSAFLRVLV